MLAGSNTGPHPSAPVFGSLKGVPLRMYPDLEPLPHGPRQVAFEMIGDDLDKTRSQLNSIRARRTKFVCVNDDMRNPSQEVQALLQHFFLSFFPAR